MDLWTTPVQRTSKKTPQELADTNLPLNIRTTETFTLLKSTNYAMPPPTIIIIMKHSTSFMNFLDPICVGFRSTQSINTESFKVITGNSVHFSTGNFHVVEKFSLNNTLKRCNVMDQSCSGLQIIAVDYTFFCPTTLKRQPVGPKHVLSEEFHCISCTGKLQSISNIIIQSKTQKLLPNQIFEIGTFHLVSNSDFSVQVQNGSQASSCTILLQILLSIAWAQLVASCS